MAGKESFRKRKPGSGLGRSLRPAGLIFWGVDHPVALLQCASMILAPPVYSSQASQNPFPPSVARAAPWEFEDPGTVRIFVGGTESAPALNTATFIVAVPASKQESYSTHATNTLPPRCMMAGLSWKWLASFVSIS